VTRRSHSELLAAETLRRIVFRVFSGNEANACRGGWEFHKSVRVKIGLVRIPARVYFDLGAWIPYPYYPQLFFKPMFPDS
jgi:hypothetical protein